MNKMPRWKISYYVSMPLLVVGILMVALSGFSARQELVLSVGAGVLIVAMLIRMIWCRCPLCGAAMLRLRGDMSICPRCGGSLRDKQD